MRSRMNWLTVFCILLACLFLFQTSPTVRHVASPAPAFAQGVDFVWSSVYGQINLPRETVNYPFNTSLRNLGPEGVFQISVEAPTGLTVEVLPSTQVLLSTGAEQPFAFLISASSTLPLTSQRIIIRAARTSAPLVTVTSVLVVNLYPAYPTPNPCSRFAWANDSDVQDASTDAQLPQQVAGFSWFPLSNRIITVHSTANNVLSVNLYNSRASESFQLRAAGPPAWDLLLLPAAQFMLPEDSSQQVVLLFSIPANTAPGTYVIRLMAARASQPSVEAVHITTVTVMPGTGDGCDIYLPAISRVGDPPITPTAYIPRTPTAYTTRTPAPAPTAPIEDVIQIIDVMPYDPDYPDDNEYVQLLNIIDNDIDMTGWKVIRVRPGDLSRPSYMFPQFILQAGNALVLYTNTDGSNRPDQPVEGNFFWNRSENVWAEGDIAELRDAGNRLIDSFVIGS